MFLVSEMLRKFELNMRQGGVVMVPAPRDTPSFWEAEKRHKGLEVETSRPWLGWEFCFSYREKDCSFYKQGLSPPHLISTS
jgi:hypothetical protein